MKIELLYFDGCPSWQDALANLETALEAEAVDADIRLIQVMDNQQADQLKFLGSPSLRLDGQDLWPETRQRYNLSCRVYATPEGLRGAPSVNMLRDAIRNLLSN